VETPFFELEGTFSCENLRGGPPYEVSLFKLVDRDGFASSLGLGEKTQLTSLGGGRPVQAQVEVSRGEFSIQYKSKRDGSLTVYLPEAGSYSIRVVRPGFVPESREIVPGDGDTLINLKGDSSFRTHTTANRY